MCKETTFEDIFSNCSLILDSMNDAVLLMNGIDFIDCNKKAIKLFGCSSKSELLRLKPYELSPEFQNGGKYSKDEALKRVKAALSGKPQFFEWKHAKLNGELIDTEVSLQLIGNRKKKNLIAVVRDITDKKKSERINRTLFNISNSVIDSNSLEELLPLIQFEVAKLMDAENFYVALVVDKEKSLFRIPYIVDENPAEMVNPDEILDLKKGYTDYVVQKEKPLLANRSRIKELIKKGEMELIGTNAESWLGVPLKLKNNEIIGVIVVQSYSDSNAYTETDMQVLSAISPVIASVIKQQRAEDAIKKSERKFKQLFDNIPDAVFITRFGGPNSGDIINANPEAEVQTGYALNELIGLNMAKDIQAERFQPSLLMERESILQKKGYVRFREKKIRKDGSNYWTEVLVKKLIIDNENVALGINRDITAQVQAEADLKESELKFRTVIEEAAEIVYTVDINGYFTYVNPAGLSSTGYSLEELKKLNYIDLVEPDYKYKVKRNYFMQYLKKSASTNIEYPFRTKSGNKKWINQNARIIIEKDNVKGFYVIARDITDRRFAEDALKESEENYHNLVDNVIVGVYKTSIEGDLIFGNEAMLKIMEFEGDYTKLNVKGFYKNPSDRELFLDQMNKEGEVRDFETELISSKGKQLNVIINAKIIGKNMTGMILDITERKKAEKEVLKLKENLEIQVAEKTKELNEKIADLERFYDATIEREFRIDDLNKKIEKLEEELKLFKN